VGIDLVTGINCSFEDQGRSQGSWKLLRR